MNNILKSDYYHQSAVQVPWETIGYICCCLDLVFFNTHQLKRRINIMNKNIFFIIFSNNVLKLNYYHQPAGPQFIGFFVHLVDHQSLPHGVQLFVGSECDFGSTFLQNHAI